MVRRAFFALLLAGAPGLASAQAPLLDSFGGTRGFGTDCLSTNDDGSSAEIDLTPAFPGGLEFFGQRHTTMYVNTNGNITFSEPLSTFTPRPFPVAEQPMIAPYWADVDIRGFSCTGYGGDRGCANPSSNGVWWHVEEGRVIVTWDQVGYYSCHTDKVMSFQLILTAGRYCGIPGDFDVEFRYNRCEWETGDASDGVDGFGGTQAQVGFDAGNEVNYVALPESRMDGISMVMCDTSNIGIPGVWQFRIRRGSVECPDAGEICDTGLMGACGEGQTQCEGSDVRCETVVSPTAESCDAIDNDCDGTVDEAEDGELCPTPTVCDLGTCIDPCFEGGCPAGETCSESGVCTEDACADIVCAEGERCIDGTCVDVCEGVMCPSGLTCRSGRCLDLCESLTCDGCQVCRDGRCAFHCQVTGCPIGMGCDEDGHCVDNDCVGVRCGPNRTCIDGRCADACVGVVCPMGEVCREGACITAGPGDLDAGGPPPTPDAGPGEMMDAGTAAPDAGTTPPPPPDDPGCGCRAVGTGATHTGWLLAALLGLAFTIRRRAR